MPSPFFLALLLAAAQPGPAQPTLPPEAARPRSPVMLFFAYDDAALEAGNRLLLDALIDYWRRTGGAARFLVEGHSDTADPAERSLDASRRRAWAVHDYLVEAGVLSPAIAVRYHGEDRPLVATEDEVREPLNRRVEIRFGPSEDAPRR